MKRTFILVVAAIAVYAAVSMTLAAILADDEAAPIFGIKIPPGYRDWKLGAWTPRIVSSKRSRSDSNAAFHLLYLVHNERLGCGAVDYGS